MLLISTASDGGAECFFSGRAMLINICLVYPRDGSGVLTKKWLDSYRVGSHDDIFCFLFCMKAYLTLQLESY